MTSWGLANQVKFITCLHVALPCTPVFFCPQGLSLSWLKIHWNGKAAERRRVPVCSLYSFILCSRFRSSNRGCGLCGKPGKLQIFCGLTPFLFFQSLCGETVEECAEDFFLPQPVEFPVWNVEETVEKICGQKRGAFCTFCPSFPFPIFRRFCREKAFPPGESLLFRCMAACGTPVLFTGPECF